MRDINRQRLQELLDNPVPHPDTDGAGEFIDYKTSMITDEDPLRFFLARISDSLTHCTFLKKGDGGANTLISVLNPER